MLLELWVRRSKTSDALDVSKNIQEVLVNSKNLISSFNKYSNLQYSS